MTDRVTVGNLRVAQSLYDFVNNEALPGTDIDPDTFWSGVDKVVADLTPKNQDLLARRDDLQAQIDKWHRLRVIEPLDPEAYKQFLTDIGYLQPEPEDFTITTSGVDDEITTTAGPQLVVPVLNARFALNAANARWGSLYDALYGTDVIPEADGAEKTSGYNKVRGDKVIAYARRFLDQAVPLESGSWADATGLSVADGRLQIATGDDQSTGLASPEKFAGYTGELGSPEWSVLLVNNGLHIEVLIDPESPVGSTDAAGIKDVVLESAVTTIMDFEDSVAAVDADDKVLGYRNWLGLNKGDLTEEVTKDGKTFTRILNQDRTYTAPDGSELTLPGRSLLFVRNVGHLMTNDAIVFEKDGADGNEVPEGIQDALFTSLIAMHGLKAARRQRATGEQPHRFDLHRQAEDARPRRGGIHRRTVRPRGGRARPAARHHQGRHHGRGAPHHPQPEGLHQGRRRPGGVHQHRIPGPHRRRDPHLDGGRADDPEGRDEDAALDQGLRGRQRRRRPGHRLLRPRTDR